MSTKTEPIISSLVLRRPSPSANARRVMDLTVWVDSGQPPIRRKRLGLPGGRLRDHRVFLNWCLSHRLGCRLRKRAEERLDLFNLPPVLRPHRGGVLARDLECTLVYLASPELYLYVCEEPVEGFASALYVI